MKTELTRYVTCPLCALVLGGGLCIRAVMTWLDRRWRADTFWALTGDFWPKYGSLICALLVLLALPRIPAMDRETGVFPVLASTPRGRKTLFRERLLAGTLAAALGALVLGTANGLLSFLLSAELPVPEGWLQTYAISTAIAAVGTAALFLFSAFLCDIARNQTAALAFCGSAFAGSFLVNTGLAEPFGFFWFLRYGTFAELLRGRFPAPLGFWALYYPLVVAAAALLALRTRKERKEL